MEDSFAVAVAVAVADADADAVADAVPLQIPSAQKTHREDIGFPSTVLSLTPFQFKFHRGCVDAVGTETERPNPAPLSV